MSVEMDPLTESDKLEEATGGDPMLMSSEEEKLLQSLKILGVENTDDLVKILKTDSKVTESVGSKAAIKQKTENDDDKYSLKVPKSSHDTATAHPATVSSGNSTSVIDVHKYGTFHYPKLPSFQGEEHKGDVSWSTFKFEVEALVVEKVFSEEQILLGIRRAMKGNASDVVRRLGTGVTVQQVITKLDSTFGNIETKESILCKFFSCKQKTNESIAAYASRLEELFAQAVTS